VGIALFTLKASYCNKGAPQKGKYDLCSNVLQVMTDAYGILRFLTIFSASLLLTLVHSAQCHPTICCKDKEVK